MKRFNKIRKRDINLEIAISDKQEILKYYLFSPSFYNTFEEKYAKMYKDKLIGEKYLKTQKLSQIFDKYLGNNKIDFLTIDVEGWDLKVLQSNDWVKYRPKVVVVEYITYYDDERPRNLETKKYLISKGYKYLCCSPTNAFFVEKKFFKNRFSK